MPEEKQMTLYIEDHATHLIHRYDQEFESYKSTLNLAQKDRGLVSQRSFSFTKVLIGSFLALSAIGMVLGSNYLENQETMTRYSSEQVSGHASWVFPVYFIAGVFSVSSVLSFKNAIK